MNRSTGAYGLSGDAAVTSIYTRPVRLQFHPFLPAVMRRLLQRTTYHSPDPISITLQWPREYVYDDGMDKMRLNGM